MWFFSLNIILNVRGDVMFVSEKKTNIRYTNIDYWWDLIGIRTKDAAAIANVKCVVIKLSKYQIMHPRMYGWYPDARSIVIVSYNNHFVEHIDFYVLSTRIN